MLCFAVITRSNIESIGRQDFIHDDFQAKPHVHQEWFPRLAGTRASFQTGLRCIILPQSESKTDDSAKRHRLSGRITDNDLVALPISPVDYFLLPTAAASFRLPTACYYCCIVLYL
jgi:hypothetical protein